MGHVQQTTKMVPLPDIF